MKSFYFAALLAVLFVINGCKPSQYNTASDQLGKIATIKVECRNEAPVQEQVQHILKLVRVSEWRITKEDFFQYIEARYWELSDEQAAQIVQQLKELSGVTRVEVERDRLPPGKM